MGEILEFSKPEPKRDPQETFEDLSDAIELLDGCVDDFPEGTVLRTAVESSVRALVQVRIAVSNGDMDF